MHSRDKLQQFLDLRSRGNCLSYISRTIGVATSTLGDWNRRYAIHIDTSRACKWEAAEQAVKFNTEADLVRVIQRIDAFERELDRRSLEGMSVGELVRVISLWRREYFRRRNGLLRSIERPTPLPEPESVTPDVRRGLTSHNTSENTATFSANAAHDPRPAPTDKPEPEPKPEKTGIPESHFPTFSPARPHAPPLFSIDDHLPTPMAEWLPDDDDKLYVYRPREAAAADNPISKKTNVASVA